MRRSRGEGTPQPRQWRPFRGGLQSIGHEGSGFCFDNEGPRHRVYLEDFELASRATTNRDYARVHRRRRLPAARAVALRWLELRNARGWEAPLYWEQVDGAGGR